jgi:recyclin-1
MNEPQKQTHISILHPILVSQIFSWLPLKDLQTTARLSRRFKVITYNDLVYEDKLKALGFEYAIKAIDLTNEMLTVIDIFGLGVYFQDQLDKETKIEDEPKLPEKRDAINGILPDSRYLLSIFGAGGFKRALRGEIQSEEIALKKRNATNSRDILCKIKSLLDPLFNDFVTNTKNASVFKIYKELNHQAALLNSLLKFSKSGIFTNDVSLEQANLNTAVEMFETNLLSQFETAYDQHNNEQMKLCGNALVLLNGGHSVIGIFVHKNPIFFDPNLNPTLLDSKLPALNGPSVGGLLAEEFVIYMDKLLKNCREQRECVFLIFDPKVDVMTVFVKKIINEFISEYLDAVLNATKSRESIPMHLHTVATAVHCCSQFINYLNESNFSIDKQLLINQVIDLFQPHLAEYKDLETKSLAKEYKEIIHKWDQQNRSDGNSPTTATPTEHKPKKAPLISIKGIMNAPAAFSTFLSGSTASKKELEPLVDEGDAFGVDIVEPQVKLVSVRDDSLNALVSLELTMELITRNKESLLRALVITANTDIQKLYDLINLADPASKPFSFNY